MKETHWILLVDGEFHVWGCALCRKKISSHWDTPDYNYCPYCGVKVHGKED